MDSAAATHCPEILFITAGWMHPSLAARWALWQALRAGGQFRLRGAPSLRALPGARAQGAVIFIHEQDQPAEAVSALEGFLRAGGGVLAVHSATASYKSEPRFGALLGGRFAGHGPVETFTAQPAPGHAADGADNPFDGLPAFTVRDELYRHDLEPGIHAHYSAPFSGEMIPVVWTHRVGAGRVCYACPGHTAVALRDPIVAEILRRGLRWACSARGSA